MCAKRKSYTPKFRAEAARLVIDTGCSIAEVAREIGVGEALLGRWVGIERAKMEDPPGALDADEHAELGPAASSGGRAADRPGVLEKSSSLLCDRELEPGRAFAVIDADRVIHSITRMAELLGVFRSGHYARAARRDAPPGPRATHTAELTLKIRDFHAASDQVNGAPRILADLRADGEIVSKKTDATLMRHNRIRGISPRPWRPVTTISDGGPHRIPDLVSRRFDQGGLNLVWTSEITYLDTGKGWLYLAAVGDGCSHRVLGYAFSHSLHTDIVETALRRAVAFRDPAAGPHRRGDLPRQPGLSDWVPAVEATP